MGFDVPTFCDVCGELHIMQAGHVPVRASWCDICDVGRRQVPLSQVSAQLSDLVLASFKLGGWRAVITLADGHPDLDVHGTPGARGVRLRRP